MNKDTLIGYAIGCILGTSFSIVFWWAKYKHNEATKLFWQEMYETERHISKYYTQYSEDLLNLIKNIRHGSNR
jgi:hypothetical protein